MEIFRLNKIPRNSVKNSDGIPWKFRQNSVKNSGGILWKIPAEFREKFCEKFAEFRGNGILQNRIPWQIATEFQEKIPTEFRGIRSAEFLHVHTSGVG